MTEPNKAPTEIEALIAEARARAIYLVDTYCPAAAGDTWEDVLMIRRLADRLEQVSNENTLYIASVERLTKAQGRAWDAGAAIGRDLAHQEQSASEPKASSPDECAVFVATWFGPEEAPFNVPLWGYRLDADKPWLYGISELVERNNDEKPTAWFTVESGEEIEPPVLWTHARIPARPLPTKLQSASEPGVSEEFERMYREAVQEGVHGAFDLDGPTKAAAGDRPLTLAEKVSASRHRPVPDESLHPHPLMHHMPSPERLREQIEADPDGHDVEAGRTTPDWPGVHGPSSNPKPDGEYALSVFDAPTDPDISAVREALENTYRAMCGATVFVTSRERIKRPEGEDLWQEQIANLSKTIDSLSRLEAQLSAPAVSKPEGLLSPAHQDTFRLVNAFRDTLADKLARAEIKYGYGNNWLTDDWEAACQRELVARVEKGDPLDVAAYAAFCWGRGWRTVLSAPAVPVEDVARSGFYVASRASVLARGEMWRRLRSGGAPIISSWIDEDGPNDTAALDELWVRILREVASAERLILYVEPDDFPLKGAFVEIGMALASSVPITIVAPGVEISGRNQRPFGSWIKHPLVSFAPTVEGALTRARTIDAMYKGGR